jgi:two-component system chemotaxis response regulator CheY
MKPVALVLDDDELFREMMKAVLAKLGFTVHAVASVEAFEKAYLDLNPDLHLIDLNVGEASGIDVVERIRTVHENVPILVVSAERSLQVVSHALEIGANDYLLKPFSRTLLAAKLGQLIRTNEIEEAELLLEGDNCLADAARVYFDAEITGIDELGLWLRSRHLVSKGTMVKIGGAFVHEVGGAPDTLMSVSTTALRADGSGYDVYAEFETSSVEFLQSVRRWLARYAAANPVRKTG